MSTLARSCTPIDLLNESYFDLCIFQTNVNMYVRRTGRASAKTRTNLSDAAAPPANALGAGLAPDRGVASCHDAEARFGLALSVSHYHL